MDALINERCMSSDLNYHCSRFFILSSVLDVLFLTSSTKHTFLCLKLHFEAHTLVHFYYTTYTFWYHSLI